MRSRSRMRAALTSRRSRPKRRSVSCSNASKSTGGSDVSTIATPFTNQGWSDRGTGADSNQRERRTIRRPRRDSSTSAASQVARGGPNSGLGKLEPIAIRMGSGKALLQRGLFASRPPLTNVKVSETLKKKFDEITINQEFVGRVSSSH